MTSENSRKIKLLKLWELLKSETDENHPMDTVEIIERLAKEGIEVDRKILYTDIETLYCRVNAVIISYHTFLLVLRQEMQKVPHVCKDHIQFMRSL